MVIIILKNLILMLIMIIFTLLLMVLLLIIMLILMILTLLIMIFADCGVVIADHVVVFRVTCLVAQYFSHSTELVVEGLSRNVGVRICGGDIHWGISIS